ncbi:PucR family transcriptional regulator [Microbacterium sp. C5A9]|uniref:PucR family transcriptional regulator n=1 Tax=Microbacterium sp. C5A9 TaxID=2736663 RepID=UPI001F524B9D|nr:PucR family transcriptional regulator [Microbacterium sp. C5A9]MCI1017524.1 PucR family transcriptional regulator [Microbacterium sp. C5A9]
MVSLGELALASGASLRPLAPFDAARSITGVHVSELDDPGRYLDGGELLLTTGIPLHADSADLYVDRLAEQGIGAIGIGLGEGWEHAPPALVERCRATGIPIFEVPDGVPFLDVSRAFWSLAGRGGQEEAMRTAHAHTRLVQAAAGPDPIGAVVRVMAQAIGGWVAWLPIGPGGSTDILHPPSLEGMLPSVRADVERSLLRSGVEAASFVSHGSTVVAHAVTDGDRTRGALAIGAGRPFGSSDRQLALTAAALLRLLSARERRGPTPEHWVAELALRGEPAAARALAHASGIPLPMLFRVVAGAGATVDGGFGAGSAHEGVHLTLISADAGATPESGVVSGPVGLEDVAAAAARVMALHRADPDAGARTDPESRSRRWADLLAHTEPELRRTVIAYLRNRHQAERTARDLGVHRNTIRPRITTAEKMLDASLDDPDVAAELWIALRDRGL